MMKKGLILLIIIIAIIIIYAGYSLSTNTRPASKFVYEELIVLNPDQLAEENPANEVEVNGKGPIFEEARIEEEEAIDRAEQSVEHLSLLDQVQEYRVRKGDNLWNIARNYGIDIDTIIGANDITNMNQIKPGDIIQILPVKGIVYKINPGESLWTISRQFGIGIEEIVKANAIGNPDLVKPGCLLILPGAKPEFGYQERLQQRFIKPVNARISSYFGMRWGKMHEGIDYAVNTGTNVRASRSGKVVYSGWASGYGETIIIEHQKGIRTLYAHNSRLLAHSGEWVEQGEVIARSGNTGHSTGPHLHFEIQINGKPVNPLSYLQ
jgi:murein DD-endopeptidase MepM/ murein hydrolase activator NlpD